MELPRCKLNLEKSSANKSLREDDESLPTYGRASFSLLIFTTERGWRDGAIINVKMR